MPKQYQCGICESKPDQLSHHKTHINTQKHRDKKSIFELTLKSMSKEELEKKYATYNITEIINKFETKKVIKIKIKIMNENKMYSKKKKTNKIVYEKPTKDMLVTDGDESFKKEFLDFLNKMHNLLRGSAVTGDQALDDILNILLLCYLFGQDLSQGQYDIGNSLKTCYKGIVQRKVTDYIKYIDYDYLTSHIEELRIQTSKNSIEKIGALLSKHPSTKNIITESDFINCPDATTLAKLIKECYEFSQTQNIFEQIDLCGIAYEYMTTKHAGNGGTSKEMGQYFTERPLMKMCFQLVDKKDISDLNINSSSTIGDEFCATFGFPIMLRKYLKQNYSIDIQDKNMYGVEYHERLSKFALMNAMFSMSNLKNIRRDDSFVTNVTPHLDFSVHNVPFGPGQGEINERKYNSFKLEHPKSNMPDYKHIIPHNTKIGVLSVPSSCLALYKTKKIGLLIIKDGEETSGGGYFIKYRKHFTENCIIKKIMKIPSGAFSCTGTKTVCIYFIKKEDQMTKNIQFLELSENGNKITEVCNVSTEELAQNNYSWNHNDYLLDEDMAKLMEKSNCEWKKLGEVCEIQNGKQLDKKNIIQGEYPIISGGTKYLGYHNKYNRENAISITSVCNIGKIEYIKGKFWASRVITVKTNNVNLISNKYISYILQLEKFQNIIKSRQHGSCQTNILIEHLIDIEIPIPSIEVQKEIVEQLVDLSEQISGLKNRKEGIDRQMKYYFKSNLKNGNIHVKKLKDIIDINIGSTPSTKNNEYWNNGDHIWITVRELKNNMIPVINSKKKLTQKAIDECKPKLAKKGTVLMSFKLSIGKLGVAGCDVYTNEAILHINTNDTELNKYLYYHIFSIPPNNNASGCIGGGSLNKTKLSIIEIILQKDKTKQKEIVQYLDELEDEKNKIDIKITKINELMKTILEQSYQ